MRVKVKNGFTISELLIALGVVAVLTAVLMPIIHSLIPDQNTLMAKRAFYTTETIISNMINDSGCYPVTSYYAGFDDGSGYKKCTDWDDTKHTNANSKFAAMFINRISLRENALQNGKNYVFSTKEGMRWDLTLGFSDGGNTVLVVDVDGTDKGPNCGQVETSTICPKINNQDRTKGFDKYTMKIQPNGRITIDDVWAANAVKTDKKLVGTDD